MVRVALYFQIRIPTSANSPTDRSDFDIYIHEQVCVDCAFVYVCVCVVCLCVWYVSVNELTYMCSLSHQDTC
jgi:hypothetical protein